MNKIKKISATIASLGLTASLMAPGVFADTELEISDNGAESNNKIELIDTCASVVNQENSSEVGVEAELHASTGGNTANGNTGADVDIDTGNASANMGVIVETGGNTAVAPDCCECDEGDVEEAVKGNGKKSRNSIFSLFSKSTSASQSNWSGVGVSALMKPRTGRNRANWNTGGDKTEIKTGSAHSFFDVFVHFGSNTLD